MLRLTECLILILCCSALGLIKSGSFKARRHELENIIETLKLIDMEITYKKEPLAKSFIKLSQMRTGWFSEILYICSCKLNEQRSLDEAWKISKKELDAKCPLKTNDIDILDDLILGLGKSDSEGQRKLFEPALFRLQRNLKDAYSQEQKTGKMYISLGTAAGVVVSIILF